MALRDAPDKYKTCTVGGGVIRSWPQERNSCSSSPRKYLSTIGSSLSNQSLTLATSLPSLARLRPKEKVPLPPPGCGGWNLGDHLFDVRFQAVP